jgi:hypothetical protein
MLGYLSSYSPAFKEISPCPFAMNRILPGKIFCMFKCVFFGGNGWPEACFFLPLKAPV